MEHTRKIKLPLRSVKLFNSISEFSLGPVIGDGGFAKVRRAIHKKSKTTYALKIMRLSEMSNGDLENIEKEIEIHTTLNSNYVVDLLDFLKIKNLFIWF